MPTSSDPNPLGPPSTAKDISHPRLGEPSRSVRIAAFNTFTLAGRKQGRTVRAFLPQMIVNTGVYLRAEIHRDGFCGMGSNGMLRIGAVWLEAKDAGPGGTRVTCHSSSLDAGSQMTSGLDMARRGPCSSRHSLSAM